MCIRDRFLLFVDGKVTQGVDMNHRDILLDRCAKGGQKYRLELQSYTGTLHTEMCIRDRARMTLTSLPSGL